MSGPQTDSRYVGPVEKVVAPGRHGPYAVMRVEGIGTVTFSLRPPVWNEKSYPERGMYVVLSQVRKMRAGWRAMSGRFMTPSDQQTGTETETATHSKEQGR